LFVNRGLLKLREGKRREGKGREEKGGEDLILTP
jgi:hypothetical protein